VVEPEMAQASPATRTVKGWRRTKHDMTASAGHR
jgi:hypothetical protein